MGAKKPGSRADLIEKRATLRAEDPEASGLAMTPKQIRARARRKLNKHQRMAVQEFEKLYKPIEEWDLEELARGRPRAADGTFKGKAPAFISREVHEKAMERFRDMVRGEMQDHTLHALKLLGTIIGNEEVDRRGRPVVAASTKLDAAKFLLEHVVGKPKQPIEADISVKLQAVLGAALITPQDAAYFQFTASSPSSARAIGSAEDEEIVDAEIEEDEDE